MRIGVHWHRLDEQTLERMVQRIVRQQVEAACQRVADRMVEDARERGRTRRPWQDRTRRPAYPVRLDETLG